MAADNPLYIDNIILNESAQFYSKARNVHFSKHHITEIFTYASSDKVGQFLLNIKKFQYADFPEIEFSICVFKMVSKPSFIQEEIPGWEEQKLAYLLIIDHINYCVIFKKNIGDVDDVLYKGLTEIDYQILSTIFIEDSTSIEKVSLNNTSILRNSMRSKIYEADNLKESLPTYGVSRYVPNSMRLNDDSAKMTIGFNTSRITNFGEKKYIYDLVIWASRIIDKISNYQERETFLDVFAKPVDYEAMVDELVPIAIYVGSSKIQEDIANEVIENFTYQKNGISRVIPMDKFLQTISIVYTIDENIVNGEPVYKLHTNAISNIELSLNLKSITLTSKKLVNIQINFENGTQKPLLTYLNALNDYTVNFDNLDLIYHNRKLYKDSKLLNSIDGFLDVFHPVPLLANATSEKGIFTTTSTAFSARSIFSYIDTTILNGSPFSLLDDLGDEWADFIRLENNTLSFIHAKHGTSVMSATAFQDVIGQAQKNIANFNPTFDRLDNHKRTGWLEPYTISRTRTRINKLRRGDTVDNAIIAYKKALMNPNLKREIILAIDFISKDMLAQKLQQLKAELPFAERNQVIQILWLISGLVNCCIEAGIEIHIHCKP